MWHPRIHQMTWFSREAGVQSGQGTEPFTGRIGQSIWWEIRLNRAVTLHNKVPFFGHYGGWNPCLTDSESLTRLPQREEGYREGFHEAEAARVWLPTPFARTKGKPGLVIQANSRKLHELMEKQTLRTAKEEKVQIASSARLRLQFTAVLASINNKNMLYRETIRR